MQSHSGSLKPKNADMFENHNQEAGEVYYTVKLDFTVGATELLAFPPGEREAQAVEDGPPGKEKAA